MILQSTRLCFDICLLLKTILSCQNRLLKIKFQLFPVKTSIFDFVLNISACYVNVTIYTVISKFEPILDIDFHFK